MNVVIRTLLFCTLATTPLLLPAAEGGEQQPTQIPPRLLREVLADQKQLTSAAAEMIFSLNGEERA